MKQTFYSNGKLLLTGEYLVLDGAKALALPTKYGQHLTVESGTNNEIHWKSFDADASVWFADTVAFADIRNKTAFENPIKNTLVSILNGALLLNPDFLDLSEGFHVSTQLTFPKSWGLGSSSTLINNIALWFNVDAFKLLQNSFGGSGYDIACAQNDSPIIYRLNNGKPEVQIVNFNPDCIENLYFVYLNKKQDSKAAIASYYKKQNNLEQMIPAIDAISESILRQTDLEAFSSQLEKHELLMSEVLEMQTVKAALFPDFEGTIKSLGAWGGDFVLAVSKENPIAYFSSKGYETIIPYHEMIK
jgi:mevalonate kinase